MYSFVDLGFGSSSLYNVLYFRHLTFIYVTSFHVIRIPGLSTLLANQVIYFGNHNTYKRVVNNQ